MDRVVYSLSQYTVDWLLLLHPEKDYADNSHRMNGQRSINHSLLPATAILPGLHAPYKAEFPYPSTTRSPFLSIRAIVICVPDALGAVKPPPFRMDWVKRIPRSTDSALRWYHSTTAVELGALNGNVK